MEHYLMGTLSLFVAGSILFLWRLTRIKPLLLVACSSLANAAYHLTTGRVPREAEITFLALQLAFTIIALPAIVAHFRRRRKQRVLH